MCLHYKDKQDKWKDLVFVTQRALEDFPCRVLPKFTPWFPSRSSDRPIRPQKAPPVISVEILNGSSGLQRPGVELEKSCQGHFDVFKRKSVTSPKPNDGEWDPQGENVPKKSRRSWSVNSSKMARTEDTQPFSGRFHKTVEAYGLHSHQRAKWIIRDLNCAPRSVEEVWSRVDHAIKHSRLPMCNANFQRSLDQIWVYSDILYCEYIGHFLRQKLQLSGEITLAVHKLGNIFTL